MSDSRAFGSFVWLFLRYFFTKNWRYDDLEFNSIKFENFYIETKDHEKLGFYILSPLNINNETKYCIFLHGTACSRRKVTLRYTFKNFVKKNYVLIVPDYRSFGDSTGTFDSKTVVDDIDLLYNECFRRFNHYPNLFCHSFGCAVALEYIKKMKKNIKLVCIAPFKSVIEISKTHSLFRSMLRMFPYLPSEIDKHFKFNNMEKIEGYGIEKIHIFHGNNDWVVPKKDGFDLSKTLESGFDYLPGGHNSIFWETDYLYDRVDAFFRQIKETNDNGRNRVNTLFNNLNKIYFRYL
ncbi:hypothetical protein GVAV_001673 [Gurleya vavrai]